MGRKCSHCGNIGHNSRTCTSSIRGGVNNSLIGGLRLFGVQLDVPSSSFNNYSSTTSIKRSFSMDCLSSCSPSSSSFCSSKPSIIDDCSNKTSIGYLSDGLIARIQDRKKGMPWTEEEHRSFLIGLEKLGKGDWRGISRNFVTTRTPIQVASHAQKYFLRLSSFDKKKRRSSLFDMVGRNHNSPKSNPRHPLPIPHLNPIVTRSEEYAWTGLLGLNTSETSLDLDTQDSHSTLSLMVDGFKKSQLPNVSINIPKPISSKVQPDLELTLAAPNSLEGNKASPSTLLVRPIKVT